MPKIQLLLHNIRSTYNVGAILRTADGFGVNKVWLSGYTPYPELPNDSRLPHLRQKITQQIHKTALGAEQTIPIQYQINPIDIIQSLRNNGWRILALEQTKNSIDLSDFKTQLTDKYLLIVGEEVAGINAELLELADTILEIAMHGTKESFNVSVATGIALYQLKRLI